MPFPDLDLYQLASDWSGWVASIAALGVFALVLRLLRKVRPALDFTFERKSSANPGPKRRQRRGRVSAQAIAVATRPAEDDAEWQAFTGILETRADRLQAVGTLQARAGHCIEAAEYTLDRLLADCAAVLLTPEDCTHMRRKRAALADPLADAPADPTPIRNPLAA